MSVHGILSATLAVTVLGCAVPAVAPRAPTAPGKAPVDGRTAADSGGVASAPRLTYRSTPQVERVLAAMSRLRGLPAKHPVPCEEVSRAELLDRVKAHVERDVPAAAVRAEGLVQKLLGTFPTDGDYEAETYRLLEGQLAGFYEPEDGTMYVARDLHAPEAADTLAHELVHALQDQHWDLRARSRYAAGQDDRSSAAAALAEGDATSAMEDQRLSREPRSRSAAAESDASRTDEAEAEEIPPGLRRALVAPYIDGARFVNALRRRGGWAAVDDAWARPPETTEQVLHPDKWQTGEGALPVPPPPAPPSEPQLAHLESNTFGEQGLRLAFEAWMPPAAARAAATGWGGDRASLFGHADSSVALMWHVRFDDAAPEPSDAFAARAFAALRESLPRLGHIAAASAASLCVERPGNGVVSIRRDGRDLFLAFGTTTTLPGGWLARMTCAEARAWADATRDAANR